MYLGHVVEEGSRKEIFQSPKHPYTQSLLSAIAVPDPPVQRRRERIILRGDVPSPIDPPSGCTFHTRCPVADLPRCAAAVPTLQTIDGSAHRISCHLVGADGAAPDLAQSVSSPA
jgi:oligopeptide/dipeptide ABC transporter ATP-binding protein